MLPITLDVERLALVLIGRDDAACRRLAALDEADARRLAVFSDAPSAVLAAAAGDRLRRRLPTDDDLVGARLVLIAGLPPELAAALAERASACGALVHVEDTPALCDLHMPAVVRRGALSLAISTGGRSPALARLLKRWLEPLIDVRWGVWLEELAAQRARWRDTGLALAEIRRRTAALVRARGWLSLPVVIASPRVRPEAGPRTGSAKQSIDPESLSPADGLLRRCAPRNDGREGDQPPGIVPWGSRAQ